jgi:hypothetical protein
LLATRTFIDLVESAGGKADIASTQGSMYAEFSVAEGKPLYPLNLWRTKSGAQLSLSLGYLAPRPAFAEEAVRRELYDRATTILGPLSTKTLNGFPGTPVTKLNEPGVAERFRSLLHDILAMAAESRT